MKKVGYISNKVVQILNLKLEQDTPIFIGDTNIQHIKNKHIEDFLKYENQIPYILKKPDYIGLNPKDKSLEYIKEFVVDGEFVKVAVRVANSGNWFVRTLYVINNKKVKNYINSGRLYKY